jgi:hypothetical protein
MRTTLTPDDDVRPSSRGNRHALAGHFARSERDAAAGAGKRSATAPRRTFKVTARDLGNLKLGLSLDNVAELIEQVEGPLHG